MYSYRLAVQQSNKSFEVTSICLDTFFDLCDQRTCNLRKNCSVVDASCSAENSLEYDIFDSESALELNPEVVTLTPGTTCICFVFTSKPALNLCFLNHHSIKWAHHKSHVSWMNKLLLQHYLWYKFLKFLTPNINTYPSLQM